MLAAMVEYLATTPDAAGSSYESDQLLRRVLDSDALALQDRHRSTYLRLVKDRAVRSVIMGVAARNGIGTWDEHTFVVEANRFVLVRDSIAVLRNLDGEWPDFAEWKSTEPSIERLMQQQVEVMEEIQPSTDESAERRAALAAGMETDPIGTMATAIDALIAWQGQFSQDQHKLATAISALVQTTRDRSKALHDGLVAPMNDQVDQFKALKQSQDSAKKRVIEAEKKVEQLVQHVNGLLRKAGGGADLGPVITGLQQNREMMTLVRDVMQAFSDRVDALTAEVRGLRAEGALIDVARRLQQFAGEAETLRELVMDTIGGEDERDAGRAEGSVRADA